MSLSTVSKRKIRLPAVEKAAWRLRVGLTNSHTKTVSAVRQKLPADLKNLRLVLRNRFQMTARDFLEVLRDAIVFQD